MTSFARYSNLDIHGGRSVVRKKERIEIVPGVFVEVVNRGFGKSFKKWKKKCESFSGEALGTKEEKGNLYEQISQHVNSQVRRANSSNSGEDGAFKVLEEVGKILEKDTKMKN